MALESPLFQSSMELLGHSIDHFVSLEELDRKLVILHLANAVELIFKDIMLDRGVSIYKGPKETVSIHGAIDSLKGMNIPIPCLNKIELLIDERNALQHRYGSPNELTTIYYMDTVMEFFEIILLNIYNQKIEEILPQFTKDSIYASFKLRSPKNDTELERLNNLAKLHPLGAMLSAVAYLENTIQEFFTQLSEEDRIKYRKIINMMDYRAVEAFGVNIPIELRKDLENVRNKRNVVAHGRGEVKKEDVKKAVDTIEKFEKLLKEAQLRVPETLNTSFSTVNPLRVPVNTAEQANQAIRSLVESASTNQQSAHE